MPTLVIENGNIVPGANSYVSMDQADEYNDNMGNAEWAAAAASPDDKRISALIVGAAYVDRKYVTRWPGVRVNGRNQPMQWPRKDASDAEGNEIGETEIPIEVQLAQMEAALRELQNPGSLEPDVIGTERVLREKVGELEVQYADDGRTTASIPTLTAVDDILAPLIGAVSNSGATFFARA